jgi:hypothetical protein
MIFRTQLILARILDYIEALWVLCLSHHLLILIIYQFFYLLQTLHIILRHLLIIDLFLDHPFIFHILLDSFILTDNLLNLINFH